MDCKSIIYKIEEEYLSPFAVKSRFSKGRVKEEEDCELRTCFARDRDRIIHSKAFRRLKHKTQVFLSPEGDHYRTRLTHTLEVSQIARSVARGLRLNEDLTEAIALGHDLGHTPYGHAGERALREFTRFNHNEQSLRVVDVLEKDGRGMNLTFEVRDGILHHTNGTPSTLEGWVVMLSDKIAYINHDLDDALRGAVISESDIPRINGGQTLSHSKRINLMILDIITNSQNKNMVEPSDGVKKMIDTLHDFLLQNVYLTSIAKSEEYKAVEMIKTLYRHFISHLDELPKTILALDASNEQKVCDHISTFSDNYAVKEFQKLYIPKGWGR